MSKKNLLNKIAKNLTKRKDTLANEIQEKHQEVGEWLKDHEKDVSSLSKGLSETIATSAATGILLLSSSSLPVKPDSFITASETTISESATKTKVQSTEDPGAVIAAKLAEILPSKPRQLNEEEMKKVEDTVKESFGLDAKGVLDGYKLNTNYSYMGGEQHLVRFQGDTLARHVRNSSEWAMFGPAGMAPGRGAWPTSIWPPARKSAPTGCEDDGRRARAPPGWRPRPPYARSSLRRWGGCRRGCGADACARRRADAWRSRTSSAARAPSPRTARQG